MKEYNPVGLYMALEVKIVNSETSVEENQELRSVQAYIARRFINEDFDFKKLPAEVQEAMIKNNHQDLHYEGLYLSEP